MAEQQRPDLSGADRPQLVDTAAGARTVATAVLDPLRARSLVGVSVRPDGGPEALARVRAELASWTDPVDVLDVVLLTTAEATWELQRRLPEGLGVYGDAVRVWHPGCHPGDDPASHPQLVLGDGGPTWAEIGSWVRAALAEAPDREVPERADQLAVVLRVDPDEVGVRLADGLRAVLPLDQVADVPAAVPPERLVRIAQGLQVRVTGRDATGRLVVSARPFAPQPDARLWQQCEIGDTVLGRVVRTRNHGALVELLPGVAGLLHISEVDDDWTGQIGDRLTRDDVVAVRLVSRAAERIHLSMRDVDATPLRPALLPDGPPWLPLPPWSHATEGSLPRVAELPPVETDPAAEADAHDPASVGDAPPPEGSLLRDLEVAVGEAAAVRQQLGEAVSASGRRMDRLRLEARELVEALERDLAEVRHRVLGALNDTGSDVVAAVNEALEASRAEARWLRQQLADLRREHDDLRTELDDTRRRARAAEQRAERARDEARHQRDRAAAARSELDVQAPLAAARFLLMLKANWLRRTTPHDRERYPWREPALGPDFLSSLTRVEGVSLERVHDVCADVACGRAADRPALAVHPLRATDQSGAPQQVREDGARAFRASLQAHTAAARRLHYWDLPDGRVELARIGYHDDFTI